MLLKALAVALVVYLVVRHVPKKPLNSTYVLGVTIAAFVFVCFWTSPALSFLELFADSTATTDKTADEAGLVFGTALAGSARDTTGKVAYSGDTVSIVNDNGMGFAKDDNTDKSKKFVKMQDVTKTDLILGKFRIQALSQTSFEKLLPIVFTEFVTLAHTNKEGQDRYIAYRDGKLTYGNKNEATKTGDYKHIFKIYNATDLIDDKNVIIRESPLLIQYVGQGAGKDSWVYVDTDGTLNANGSSDQATKFHITNCAANCAGPNWRFL